MSTHGKGGITTSRKTKTGVTSKSFVSLSDADDTLNEGEEVQAVLYYKDTDYVDDDGYYISPVFQATTNLERVDNLEDGDMTIMYDKFEEDGTTWTVYYVYETTVTPTVAVTSISAESGYAAAVAEEKAAALAANGPGLFTSPGDLYGAASDK